MLIEAEVRMETRVRYTSNIAEFLPSPKKSHSLSNAGDLSEGLIYVCIHAGEVTKGVPTLADLLQSDGETEYLGSAPEQVSHRLGGVTESVPTLGDLLEDDDDTQPVKDDKGDEGYTLCRPHFLALLVENASVLTQARTYQKASTEILGSLRTFDCLATGYSSWHS